MGVDVLDRKPNSNWFSQKTSTAFSFNVLYSVYDNMVLPDLTIEIIWKSF